MSTRVPDGALELLLERGFDATSVDALAAAAGMGRSTFFRRFGSKEGMVFADHEAVLADVRARLAAGRADPLAAVVDAALSVFDHHAALGESTLLRHRLLREVPALRDRELVTTHRYERAFRHGLEDAYGLGGAGPDSAARVAATALAAGTVAVHNAFLRAWLRDPAAAPRDALRAQLESLAALFAPRLAGDDGGAPGPPGAPRGEAPAPGGAAPPAVVVVLPAGADRRAVLDAVDRALPHHP